ncbi:MAG: class II aldolase/adducin family protein, partial [Chloroflexota bacterium]|nr:class II aldolase/adducin family protein [Chloroflexota bacterium]
TRAGQLHHWNLSPGQILSAPIDSDALLENPLHSKESISHLLVYRAFPQINGIIHSHPFNILPFCVAEKPIKALLKSTQVLADEFEFIAEKPMYSKEQGEEIVRKLRGKEEKMKKFGAAVLMPQHGIFVVGPTLFWALDCLERVETNAWCQIAQKWIA